MPQPCHTAFRFGSRIAHCMSSHGSLNLINAVQKSCNIYFYQVGIKFGDKIINKYAKMLGLRICYWRGSSGRKGWVAFW